MVKTSTERVKPLEKSKTQMDWIDRIPKNVQTQKQLLKNRLERENTEIHVHVSVGKSVVQVLPVDKTYRKLNQDCPFNKDCPNHHDITCTKCQAGKIWERNWKRPQKPTPSRLPGVGSVYSEILFLTRSDPIHSWNASNSRPTRVKLDRRWV